MDVVQFEAVFIFIYFLFFYFFNLICVSLSVLLTLLEFIIGLIFFHDGFTNLFCPFLISIYKHIYIYLPNLQPLNQLLFSFTFNTPCFLTFVQGFIFYKDLFLYFCFSDFTSPSLYIYTIYIHTQYRTISFKSCIGLKRIKMYGLVFSIHIYMSVCAFFQFLVFCSFVAVYSDSGLLAGAVLSPPYQFFL